MTSAPRPRRSRRILVAVVALGLVVAVVGVGAVATNTLGAANLYERAIAKVDRFLAGPVPDRAAPDTVIVSAAPEDNADRDPDESPIATPIVGAVGPEITPIPGPTASATPTPTVPRVPVTFDIVADHKAVFAHELKVTWCASAGVQMALPILGHGEHVGCVPARAPGPGPRVGECQGQPQRRLGAIGHGARSRRLRRAGLRGPRVPDPPGSSARRGQGDHEDQDSPVILLAWRGAHTWVMTGFKADADPTIFPDAKIAGTYILDPWYPRTSRASGARPIRPEPSRTTPR